VSSTNSASNLSVARSNPGSIGDSTTYGYVLGGFINATPTPSVVADRLTYSTGVTAANSASNLTVARFGLGGLGNTVNGYLLTGGYGSGVDNDSTVDRLVFSTGITSALSTSMSNLRRYNAVLGDQDVAGFAMGGLDDTGFTISDTEKLTYATENFSAASASNLTGFRYGMGNTADAVA
jgi:hypothetical protein